MVVATNYAFLGGTDKLLASRVWTTLMTNRFPGSVEELEACFVGNDATHSSLRIYFEDERGRRSAAEF